MCRPCASSWRGSPSWPPPSNISAFLPSWPYRPPNEKSREDGHPTIIPSPPGSYQRHAVIVVDRAVARGVGPIPVVVIAVFWRGAQLALGDAGDVAAEPRVV